jgi:hypothetical protein
MGRHILRDFAIESLSYYEVIDGSGKNRLEIAVTLNRQILMAKRIYSETEL